MGKLLFLSVRIFIAVEPLCKKFREVHARVINVDVCIFHMHVWVRKHLIVTLFIMITVS